MFGGVGVCCLLAVFIWRLERTWKRQVDEEGVRVGLRSEDGLCRSTYSVGVNQIAAGLR